MSQSNGLNPQPDRVFEVDTFVEVVTDAAVTKAIAVPPPPPPPPNASVTETVDSMLDGSDPFD